MAISLHGLGSLHYKQGEYERARQLYQQSLAINQELAG
jgi:tetratricopeptide (TPR) repeat protein